jgi:CRP-like cAMP-binding protein
MGKKFYGNVFVTVAHFAFLPGTISQQNERWIALAEEVETAFVDKNGALEILFVGNEIRHLYHEDRSVLMEIVSSINHMKTVSQPKSDSKPAVNSPAFKRHNIRSSVQKAIQKSQSKGSLTRRSSRRTSLPPSPATISAERSSSGPGGNGPSAVGEIESIPSAPKANGSVVAIDDDDADANTDFMSEAELASFASGPSQPIARPAGVSEDWSYIRLTDLLDGPSLRKILDNRMKKSYAAGSTILKQDVSREVAIQVLWKGSAKAVRTSPGKPDLFLGYINEGSVFGETAYLLEANAGSAVVALTDCVVYNLSGPWLDGLFDMDRKLGAQFFEMICMVLLERSVLSEELFKSKSEDEDEEEMEEGGL